MIPKFESWFSYRIFTETDNEIIPVVISPLSLIQKGR